MTGADQPIKEKQGFLNDDAQRESMAYRLRGDYLSRDICGCARTPALGGGNLQGEHSMAWHGRRVISMQQAAHQARLSRLGEAERRAVQLS